MLGMSRRQTGTRLAATRRSAASEIHERHLTPDRPWAAHHCKLMHAIALHTGQHSGMLYMMHTEQLEAMKDCVDDTLQWPLWLQPAHQRASNNVHTYNDAEAAVIEPQANWQ